MKTRQNLVKELSTGLSRLKSDQFGRFIITKYGVELFKHSPEDWTTSQNKEMSTKKLFADILGDDNEQPPKKKSKK
jgi:hypothetical protein